MEENISPAKHKFITHLLKLSKATNIEDAMKEWNLLTKKSYEELGAQCICQHMIKHVWYVYNQETGKTITVGSGCCKKFKIMFKDAKKNMFMRLIAEWIEENGYEAIDDIEEFARKVKQKLLALCEKRANYCLLFSGTLELEKLKKELEELISIKGVTYLTEILSLVIAAIDKKTKEQAEEHARQEKLKRKADAEKAEWQEKEKKRIAELEAKEHEMEKQTKIAINAEIQRLKNQGCLARIEKIASQQKIDAERIARAIKAGKEWRDKESHKFPAFIASLPPAQRFIQEAAAKVSKGTYDPTQTEAYKKWVKNNKILALTPQI